MHPHRRNLCLALLGIASLFLGGCQYKGPLQRVRNEAPDALNQTPLVVDGAMQMRDWGRSTAFYSNGDTIAWPVGAPYQVRWNRSEWIYAVEESPLFIVQTVLLPVRAIVAPPWQEHRYKGATIEPTYTAMPVQLENGSINR